MAGAIAKKYEALTLRERAFVMLAVLGLAILGWDSLLMEPLRQSRMALEAELAAVNAFGANRVADDSDPRQVNIMRAGELQTQLAELDAQLQTTTSGFVSADRMIEVLHDVLERQGNLALVSIRNLPVQSLVQPDETGPAGDSVAAPVSAPAGPQPPFVHAVEIIIDGQYADILDYIAALEALPWKFRWASLDLSTAGYPRNRVRIELATLSLDATWLGV
jgi:MSHA biogenesis protein MshJ